MKEKKQGFRVPDNYFENLEAYISLDNGKDKVLLPKESGYIVPENYFELTELQPLDLIKKSAHNNSFTVPENYFENFEVKIPQPKAYVEQIKSRIFYFSAIAASLFLILAIGNLLSSENNAESQVEISMKDLESWFDDNAGVLTSSEIVDTYDDLTLNLNSFSFNGEIADYLAEEDLEDIIIQEEP
ncbi:hypothetical protein [Namhaeicola litoreus]|uniref:Uncharacterized protein n=1 Tax=Namhaeicola litoreus TaxID=1052145 RepID=A0ABW3Y234_9FLAO